MYLPAERAMGGFWGRGQSTLHFNFECAVVSEKRDIQSIPLPVPLPQRSAPDDRDTKKEQWGKEEGSNGHEEKGIEGRGKEMGAGGGEMGQGLEEGPNVWAGPLKIE